MKWKEELFFQVFTLVFVQKKKVFTVVPIFEGKKKKIEEAFTV